MGIHVTPYALLSLAATTATGTATLPGLSSAPGTYPHKRAVVGIRVAAFAGWGGTVTLTPRVSAADTIGGEPTEIKVGDLTTVGTAGVADVDVSGWWGVTVSVAGNDKALTVLGLTFDATEG